MYYLQLALLALGALLFNYNISIAMLCIIIFLLITLKNKNLNARKTIISVIVFLAFFIRGAYVQKTNITHLSNKENIVLQLKVEDKVVINGNYLKGAAKLGKEKVLFNYIVKSEEEKKFFIKNFSGGILKVNADIEDISDKKNFYSFDYKQYNFNKGIFKSVKINNIKKIEDNKGLLSKLKKWRNAQVLKIHNNVTFDRSGYVEALVFGDKTFLERDEVNNFKNLGTSHLLAISGLHLGVLVSLIYYIFRKICISIDIVEKIVFTTIPLYMIISGLSPSVLRAGGMIMIYIIFRKKSLSRVEALLLTFIIMTFINPLFIFDIGFELSFLITFCLLMSEDFIKGSKNKVISSLKISLVSTLASTPILIANFYSISYISIVSNIILVPIFSIIIFPLVLLSYLVSILSLSLFNIICRPLLNLSFSIFDRVQDVFLYFDKFVVGKHSAYFGIAVFIIIFLILVYLSREKYYLSVVSIAILVVTLFSSRYIVEDKFEKISIGKEDVYYLRQDNKNLLINTSNNVQNFYTDFRKKDREYDIMNEYNSLLEYEGKRKIDYLLLTSNKKKDVGYASELIGKGKVKNLIVIDKVEKNLKDIIDLANFKKIKVTVLNRNEEFYLGNINISYDKNDVRVKDSSKEFNIEVVD